MEAQTGRLVDMRRLQESRRRQEGGCGLQCGARRRRRREGIKTSIKRGEGRRSRKKKQITGSLSKKKKCPNQTFEFYFAVPSHFKVNHPSIESVDGVCVICTFFPDSASEEIQIKGRAARQGKKGTFEFILCQSDVQRDFSATPEHLKDSPYEFLVKQRTTQTDQLLDAKIEQVCSLLKMLHLH